MKQFEAIGYVLNRKNLKDSDRILTVFTHQSGKISLVAKGIKKPKAKLQSQVEPLVEIKFRYLGNGKLPVLVGAQAIEANAYFDSAIEQRLIALLATETLSLITIEGQPNEDLYRLYKSSLESMLNSKKLLLELIYLLINMMKLSGIEPHVDGTSKNAKLYFDYDEGRVANKIGNHKYSPISHDVAKLWMICTKYHKQTVLRLRLDAKTLNNATSLLVEYLQYHYGKKIKSYKVLINSTNLLQASA